MNYLKRDDTARYVYTLQLSRPRTNSSLAREYRFSADEHRAIQGDPIPAMRELAAHQFPGWLFNGFHVRVV